MSSFKYRPEIDGLRAIAVSLVVLFHLDLGFSGGFVGVDVFFVISGYLITGVILKEQSQDKFTLWGFWERRVRRIIPAATFLVAATFLAGIVLLRPSDLRDLARSAFFQQLIISNVYFWLSIDYFNAATETMPLLHTWSLAVEEKFYLFYPFILWWTRGRSRRFVTSILLVLFLLSLALSVWAVRTHPSAAFYLLPSRAWELLLGGILSVASLPRVEAGWKADTLSCLGLLAVGCAGWCYNSEIPFPGSAALLPCLGTALIILSSSGQQTIVGKALAQRPLVFVGLISYSLYLWHWPLLALAKYSMGEILPLSARLLLLVASFALATLSWKYIEIPFRRKGACSGRSIPWWLTAASSTSVVLGVSWLIFRTNGMDFRFSEQCLRFDQFGDFPGREFEATAETAAAERFPVIGDSVSNPDCIDFMIWGDSHARAIAHLCDKLARKYQIRGTIATRIGTIPLLGVDRPKPAAPEAIGWNDAVLQFIKRHHIRNVILASYWQVNVEGRRNGSIDTLITDYASQEISREESKRTLQRGLERTLLTLSKLDVKVWLMEQVPDQGDNPNRRLFQRIALGLQAPSGVSLEEHLRNLSNVNAVLKSLSERNCIFLDPTSFCFDKSGYSRIADVDGPFYWDHCHLSSHGCELLLTGLLDPVFAEIASDRLSGSRTGTHSLTAGQRKLATK